MDAPSFADRRRHDTWLETSKTNFDGFKKAAAIKTRDADWPLAHSVQKNILIYDGNAVRAAAKDTHARKTLMAEWADALLSGPGVIVIKNAVDDMRQSTARPRSLKPLLRISTKAAPVAATILPSPVQMTVFGIPCKNTALPTLPTSQPIMPATQ